MEEQFNNNQTNKVKKEISIGQKIRELRMRKGYSQENLAEMLEMTTNGYAKI